MGGMKHDPRIINGRPADLQPLVTIDPLRWQGRPVPEREWLVRDMVPLEAVTLLSGHGGAGKSILMLQLLVCASLGLPWLGFETKHVNCVGFFAEDPESELHRRLAAVLRHYGRDFGELENLTLLDRVDQPNWLMEWGAVWESGNESALYYQLERLVLDRGVGLLVIDSLYNVFTGSKLEERHAWEFMSVLGRLARRMKGKGAVIVTYHPSKAGLATGEGDFGSVGWHNAARSRLYLARPKDDGAEASPDLRELRSMKANFAGQAAPIKLEWKDGAFAYVDQPQGVFGTIERNRADHVFLACLDATLAQNRAVSDSRNAGNYGPRIFASMPQAQGTKANDLAKAMERLFAAGTICMGTHGFTSSRHPRASIVRTRPVPQDGGASG